MPNRLLLWSLAGDADSSTTTIGSWRVLLDLAKLDALGGYIVAGIGEIEHAPEDGVGVGLGYLEEREIRGVRRGEGELVDGGDDAGVGYGPFEVPGGFAADDSRGGGGTAVARIAHGTLGAAAVAAGWEELSDAEVALG